MSVSTTIGEFDVDLAQRHIKGAWQYENPTDTVVGKVPLGVPAVWRWKEVHEKLLEACEVFPDVLTARRGLEFINPALHDGSTHTLLMGMQMLKPGEVAWAHRHTFAAIRFAIEGGLGLATVTDGEVCTMEDYDLVLTPRWCWHDHHNSTENHVTWFDTLDIGLINLLNVNVYEPYGDERQPQRPNHADYVSQRTGLLRPVWEERPQLRLPMRYPWRDAEAKLMEMAGAGGSPYDGVVLEYVNPMTGGFNAPDHHLLAPAACPGSGNQSASSQLVEHELCSARSGEGDRRRHRAVMVAPRRVRDSELGVAPPHKRLTR